MSEGNQFRNADSNMFDNTLFGKTVCCQLGHQAAYKKTDEKQHVTHKKLVTHKNYT